MPLIFNKSIDIHNTQIAIWECKESNNFFINELKLDSTELNSFNKMKAHRQKEWLGSQYLFRYLIKENNIIIEKDNNGKPHVANSNKHISVSHSQGKVAVILSDVSVGIDIQREENKIKKIHQKFISSTELESLDNENLMSSYHVYWGAKEAMYKSWGKKELDFRKHMHVYPFKYFKKNLELKGWVRKEGQRFNYDLYTDKIEDSYLVYAIMNYEL